MSDFDNPFPDPFADQSVQRATKVPTSSRPNDDFNPFADSFQPVQAGGSRTVGGSGVATLPPTVTAAPPPPIQPVEQRHSTSPPPAYVSDAEELKRRQEELDRKAAELQRREEQIERNAQQQVRINNFPPLPAWCPIQPCFYQDISLDIPSGFQSIVRTIYYLWIGYTVVLFLNVIGSLSYFILSTQVSAGNRSGVTFGLSLLFLILFAPCSFVCWYRPVYKAFKSDSSFNFFFFFFVFFFQFCVCILQFFGFDGLGTVGLISSLDMFGKPGVAAKGVAGFMLIIGFLFLLAAVFDIIMLIRVHRVYRSTGASFAKAQAEFAHGVMSNRTVQQTAGNAAASFVANAGNQPASGASR